MKRLLLLLVTCLCMGLGPANGPQIPQKEVSIRVVFAGSLSPSARDTAQAGVRAAVNEWETLVPKEARFRLLSDTSRETPDFYVEISPATIANDEGCLGYYDGHYTKGRTKIYGVIHVISEWGHWRTPREAIPMDFWDYKFVAMHELGHLLGLAHHEIPHGIMNYFDHTAAIDARPSQDEIDFILAHKVGLETEVDKCSVLH